MNRYTNGMWCPAGLKVNKDTLPAIAAMAVESVGGRIWVYEDAWNGTLLFTISPRRSA